MLKNLYYEYKRILQTLSVQTRKQNFKIKDNFVGVGFLVLV